MHEEVKGGVASSSRLTKITNYTTPRATLEKARKLCQGRATTGFEIKFA